MLAREFYSDLTAEVLENTTGLDTEPHQGLRDYYRGLGHDRERSGFHCYSWIRRTKPMVHLLQSLPARDEVPWQVLDAGCGFGTESIFWSTLRDDVQVIGVDLSASRLNVAQARLMAYEQELGKSLNVRFLEQDVFSTLADKNFDVVWTMEALSHIDPAEQFLAAVAQNLGDCGHLVVSDSHIWNPVMAWRVLELRR